MKFVDQGIVLLLLVQATLGSPITIGDTRYLIVSPKTYRIGTTARLGVDLFGDKACDVRVNLIDKDGGVLSTAKERFSPGKHGELKLKIPATNHRYGFTIQGEVCGHKTEKKYIQIRSLRDNVFIQTDKPIYKPGQKIHMRIISVCNELKPVGNEVSEVTIEEPSGSRIMQWKNVKLEDGIASMELQLSKEPVLGKYKIKAIVGKTSTTQQIEVAKYVLPKFEVKIKPPPYMALDQKDLTTTICARYTYGKDVKGKLNAVLCFKHSSYNYTRRWRRIYHSACHNITRNIDGCTDIILSRDELKLETVKQKWRAVFHITAAVTETLTGIKLVSENSVSNLRERSTLMSFDGTSSKFKPGLPFKYMLKVTHPDGTPAVGANVKVTITRGLFDWGSSTVIYNKTFVITNGLIMEELKNLAYNANSLNFMAELLDVNPYKTRTYRYPAISRHDAYAWYSPSLSYLQISKTKDTPARVGSDGILKVRYTVRNDTGNKVDFYYNVICRGNIVSSGVHTKYHPYVQGTVPTTTATPTTTASPTAASVGKRRTTRAPPLILRKDFRWRWRPVTPPPLKDLPAPVLEHFEIKFPVTINMVPSCRVLMYYVRSDKETVADSIVYDIEDTLENQVSVSFSDNETKPGEKTKLILKAKPGSRVAFVAVDKSVHLLRAGNELKKGKIMNILQRQDPGRSWMKSNKRCRFGNPYWRGKRSIIFPGYSNYEDASEAFMAAGVIFLSNLSIFTKPCPTEPFPVAMEMSMVDSDADDGEGGDGARVSLVSSVRKNKVAKPKAARVRKDFPETWLWADEKLSSTSGVKTIEVTVPDTITTWIANGFAMSSLAGIGVSDPASIKAFQPFFVQMTLPYSVIRGEEIPVTVTVFNYMTSCVPIKLELSKKSLDYKVTSYHINKLCVCGDAGQSVKFTIIPTTIGHIPLTVKATTSAAKVCRGSTTAKVTAGDAVTRKLLVEPEGVKQEYAKGTFFCPKGGQYSEVFDLDLPKEIVPGSVYPTVSIIGDIMGPALSNLDGLLAMPYGCGEQNMARFAPNIYIMDYLTKTNQATGDVKEKAERFMRSGYQRELTYKRKNGSYSAFGNRDKQGSMMLTAFVVRSFARAKNYIFVDDKQVEHSFKWFEGKQLNSGCFPKYGKVFSRRLQGGVTSELTITVYVTVALLEAGQDPTSPMVSKALSCITNQLNSVKDSYTTALVAYTLALAKHSKAADMIKQLKSKAITKGDQMYWSASSDTTAPTTPPSYWWYYRTPSADVEMTGYALLAILKHGDSTTSMSSEVLNIIRWLSKQRNAYGGFSSTQDTCVALQALAEFAGMAYGDNADFKANNLEGSLKIKDVFSHNFTVSNNNRLVLQRVELPGTLIPSKLQLTATGVGCAMIQTSVKYNIPTPKEIPAFEVKVDVRRRRSTSDEEISACEPLKLDISAKWLKEDVSNMAVVDIKLVTGFSVKEDSLEELRNDLSLNFKRYDIDGQNVILYFDEIKNMRFSINIHQDTLVKNLKPAVVRVYDYYDPESQAEVMYSIGVKECYGDKIYRECPKCIKIKRIKAFLNATVNCGSTVSRVKAKQGMMFIGKSYINAKKQNRVMLPFTIPDFCPCEEIYNNGKALVIGKRSYFKETGKETMLVLDSGTTIVKWKKKRMNAKLENLMKILKKCKNQG